MTSDEIEWRLNEALKEIPEAIGINNTKAPKQLPMERLWGLLHQS